MLERARNMQPEFKNAVGLFFSAVESQVSVFIGLRACPKAYLLYRLNRVKEFRRRAAELEGEAQAYYAAMADIALGEITSVLYRGTTISKAEARLDSSGGGWSRT